MSKTLIDEISDEDWLSDDPDDWNIMVGKGEHEV